MQSERNEVWQFIKELVIPALTIIVLVVVILVMSVNPDGYNAELGVKDTIMRNTVAPRLIIVGGSGIAFGLDSSILHEGTHMNPANMGLVVGYGLDFMLAQAEAGAQAGDTILVIPEYDLLDTPSSAQGLLVLDAMQTAPALGWYATDNWTTLFSMIRDFPTWLSTRLISVVGRKVLPTFLEREDTFYRRVYRVSNFDGYGDLTGALRETMRLKSSDLNATSTPYIDDGLNTKTLGRLATFIADEKRRGVTVLISWPPLPETTYELKKPQLTAQILEIENEFGSDIILGKQTDFVFADSEFLDTINHLAGPAREKRSKQLAKLLNNWYAQHALQPSNTR